MATPALTPQAAAANALRPTPAIPAVTSVTPGTLIPSGSCLSVGYGLSPALLAPTPSPRPCTTVPFPWSVCGKNGFVGDVRNCAAELG